jgi:ribosomal protein L11 methylase PrmA
MASELCRAIAYEAAARGARVNVHELWATLEAVDDLSPKLIVDIGSGPGVLWAWWLLGAKVVGVSWAPERVQPSFSTERLPDGITDLVADPRERDTVLRVTDQVARRPVDVLVLGGVHTEEVARAAFGDYSPLVRPGGLVLVHGIADWRSPGVRKFWQSLASDDKRQMVGGVDPIGYGILGIQGRDRATHG